MNNFNIPSIINTLPSCAKSYIISAIQIKVAGRYPECFE